MTALNLPPNLTLLLLFFLFLKVIQSCPTLCSPMDCSPPGFSVHAILQARILEWVAIGFLLHGIFPIQGLNPGLPHCGQIFTLSEPPGKPTFNNKRKEFSNVDQSFVFQHNIHIFCDAGLVDRTVILLLSVLEYELQRSISAKVYP